MSKEGIMENRYLPGMLYWEKAGQSVWRMYDQLLEIKVLAFRAKEAKRHSNPTCSAIVLRLVPTHTL